MKEFLSSGSALYVYISLLYFPSNIVYHRSHIVSSTHEIHYLLHVKFFCLQFDILKLSPQHNLNQSFISEAHIWLVSRVLSVLLHQNGWHIWEECLLKALSARIKAGGKDGRSNQTEGIKRKCHKIIQ